jgi:AcrR family transcriptional regulator
VQRQGLTRRQAELLDRWCDLALAEGFAHLTLDDLAARLRCSKTTLYALAPSREQLAALAVTHFFKRATADVESALEADRIDPGPGGRVHAYLEAIARALEPASRQFIADVAAFAPTRSIYQANAAAAAARVRDLVAEGVASGEFVDVHAGFVAELVGVAVEAIQRGDISRRTGLSDADAFSELSRVVLRGLSAGPIPQVAS